MKDPLDFSKNVFGLINTALGVRDEEIQEIEVTQEQIDEMEPKQPETPSEATTDGQASATASEDAPEHEVVELDDTQVNVEKVVEEEASKADATET